MTRTDLCVNSVQSVPVIFEPLYTLQLYNCIICYYLKLINVSAIVKTKLIKHKIMAKTIVNI
jgi:hypothetical protein